ncbi:FixH family protein [Halodurantibacterium flavum]|uniref:FixH family protein n=1 Tax=Halodurantibacterium flavum TaxID=1382802 RepID=A0ABW4S976_9RHOB
MSISAPRPLTGRKVLAITCSAFSIIIAVNVVMAVKAVGTFSGLEVQNSYIASQHFNADRAAQVGLGWAIDAQIEKGLLTLRITDADGRPAQVSRLEGILGRPTHLRDDQMPAFIYRNGRFVAPVTVETGNWNLRLTATASDGTVFRQRVVLYVRG